VLESLPWKIDHEDEDEASRIKISSRT